MKNTASFISLSRILNELLTLHKNDKHIQLSSLILELNSLNFYSLIFITSITFCIPIPLPGLSTPFGLLLSSIGLALIFGWKFWLPCWIMKKNISYDTLKKIIRYVDKILEKVEKVVKGRWPFFSKHPLARWINGFIIFIEGLLLALPLPIPFTNMIAAIPLAILSIGLLEKDGVVITIAYFFFAISMIGFTMLFWGIGTLFHLY